jgi:transcriptional regulator with XRE-family HTH domain
MEFSDRLKELRKAHHLTQAEFAKKSNISRSIVAMYETGKRKPSFEVLEFIADFFNVDLNYIIGKSDLTTKVTDSSPQLSKDDQALLHAFHNASEEAKGMVRFALRPTWPKDIDQFVDKVAEGKVAKATKDKVKEAMAEGKSIVIPSKPNKKLPQLPEGFTAVKTRLHTRVTPTMSTHCKAIFRSINAEAFDDEDIRKKLDSYRETLMDKNVATFISNTMDLLEERFSMVDESRVYAIIAEEVLKDDFVERYVSFGQQGIEKLIKRLRNRFR